MAFSDPIATSQPLYDSKPNTVVTPNSWWGPEISAPYPTNAWFMDFILDPNPDQLLSNGDRRTSIYPYNFRARSNGFDVNTPFIRTYSDNRTMRNEYQINYDATATNWGWTSDQSPQIWRYLDLTLRSTETISSRYVKSFDQLSATLRWNVDETHYMEAPVVRGMAYSTMRYTALTPVFETSNTDYHAIATVNGSAPSGTVSGTKFKMTINRPYLGVGATETWILYSSSSITFNASAGGLTATAPFTGYLRLAMVSTGSGSETALDTYKDAVPIGGTSSVSVSGNSATTTFTYTKIGVGSSVLIFCLPHHQAILSSPTYAPNYSFTTLRGTLHAVVGNTWTMTDPLSTITWNSPNAIDSSKISAITTALEVEKTFQAHNLNATEAYTFGKQISRAGRLALIADQLGDTTTRDSIVDTMKTYLNPWLNNEGNSTTIYSIVYDTTWGGVLSTNALVTSPPGSPNQATEFGHAVYNDHYFHWGYYIYGAAVIAHFDPAWGTTYRAKVNDIIRDIANPSTSDPYFTQFRHLDWYEGHSWAAGLQANGDGRNQESTSEALHGWYGINLWGLATNQPDLRNVGRYLQAKEARAAQMYWQMPSTNNVYPAPFAAQKMVALVFASKVFNATWFGLADDQVVGIETMPFTPASHELLPKSWVEEMFPVRLASKASTASATLPGGWLGNTYGAKAIIDPDGAFTDINALTAGTVDPEYIDKQGASKTNFLWWSAVQDSSVQAPVSTSTSLSISPVSTAALGASVTFTGTVSPAAAGTISFHDNGSLIGSSPVSGSTASFSLTTLTSGGHSFTAIFTPSDPVAYSSSTSTATSYTITGGAATTTTTSLGISPVSTAVVGATVTLTATINPAAAGSVSFTDGGSPIGSANVTAGTASITTSSLSVGAHTLQALFTASNPAAFTNSSSSTSNYTITSAGGGGGGSTSNANAVPYLALSRGQPSTALRTGIANANYTVLATDTIVAMTTLTTSRVVTLPSASAVPAGKQVIVKDESGSCSGSLTITVAGAIDGGSNYVLNSPYANVRLYSSGAGWYRVGP